MQFLEFTLSHWLLPKFKSMMINPQFIQADAQSRPQAIAQKPQLLNHLVWSDGANRRSRLATFGGTNFRIHPTRKSPQG
jgi:hypothetical protein